MKEDIPARLRLIEAITTPLGFFVLALLIVETFLATVLVGGNLQLELKVVGMWAGLSMFVLVVIAVFVLVWSKPSHITFDKDAHLIERGKITAPYSGGADTANVLRAFWKPDGETANRENAEKLTSWMEANGLGEVFVAGLLNASIFREARSAAIRQLNIKTPA